MECLQFLFPYKQTSAEISFIHSELCSLTRPSCTEANKFNTDTTMDSEYLKQHVAKALKFGLSEICQKKPSDPIQYLSEWLLKYVENMEHQKRLAQEQVQLAKEREMAEEEKRRAKAIKEEQAQMG